MRGLALCVLLAVAGAAAEEPGRVTSEVHVARILVDAVVLDGHGAAIPGLHPADFRARVGGRPAELEAAEWIPAAVAEAPPVTADGVPQAQGRLLVLLVQNGLGADRMIGLLRLWQAARELLDTLVPTDRVAVLAYGGHLRLVQDFTADPLRVRAGFRAAMLGRRVPAPGADAPFPALAPALGEEVLQATTSVEKGLEAIGRALSPVGGAKSIVFVGWGLLVNHAPSEAEDLGRADEALRAARTSVFTLDPTDADFHTLEMGLQFFSVRTGGLYAKTHLFPRQAVSRVAQALSGRYVLVLVAPEGAPREVEIELQGRRGEVLVRN